MPLRYILDFVFARQRSFAIGGYKDNTSQRIILHERHIGRSCETLRGMKKSIVNLWSAKVQGDSPLTSEIISALRRHEDFAKTT